MAVHVCECVLFVNTYYVRYVCVCNMRSGSLQFLQDVIHACIKHEI